MAFKNTADPDVLTTYDVARWCEELATLIRENPTAPKLWLEKSHLLHRKIEAISKFYEAPAPEVATCIVDISRAPGLLAAFTEAGSVT